MKCSLHGSCIGSYCRCDAAFVGLTCEEGRNALTVLNPVHGYVDQNYWNFYKYAANSENPFKIVLTHNSAANCDIYVLNSAKPTRFIYLYRNISLLTETSTLVYNPSFFTWWIGVYGATMCEYDLHIEEVSSGTSSCGTCVHGHCVDNLCLCDQNWFGPACDGTTIILTNGIKSVEYSITNGGWIYFEIDVVASSQLIVVVQETETSGLVWVYVAKETYPTLAFFEASDNFGLSTHRISMEFSLPKTLKFIIGVYGSPFILQQQVKFTLAAYYTPF